nr:xylulose kinase-1 [Tanacetum cinerariifolium]
MIAYLTKSNASEGFNQVIDFLNGSSITYALTVNPNIYVSCIKQFWTSVAVKKVNDVTRLEALVDKTKVVITEAMIREALHVDDAEGVKCLPNEEIFAELAKMGYEKPYTKLTFYNAFFSSQWKKQVDDLSTHTTKYTSPALTQKVFAKIRRVGKGFSRVETPLFEGMIVEQQVAEGADEVHDEDVPAASIVVEGDVSAANDKVPTADKVAQALEITKMKSRVKKLERMNKTSKIKRIKKVRSTRRIDTSDDTVMDDVSNQGGIIGNIDADEDVVLEDAKDVAASAKDGQDVDIDENADIQGRTAESKAQIYKIDLEHANKVLSMQDEEESKPVELQEVVDVVTTTKIIIEVVTAASTIITVVDVPIPAATTVAALTLTAAPSRRTKGVVIRDPKESATPSTIIHSEAKSKDKGKGILVEEPKPLKKQAQIKQDEQYARELEAE